MSKYVIRVNWFNSYINYSKKVRIYSRGKKYLDILIQEGYKISKKLYLEGLKSAGEK